MPVVVKAQPGDTTDKILRKFKKKVLQSQILTELKDRQFYLKPAEKKKQRLAPFRRRKKRGQKRKNKKITRMQQR